jgi:hypothetical protein
MVGEADAWGGVLSLEARNLGSLKFGKPGIWNPGFQIRDSKIPRFQAS